MLRISIFTILALFAQGPAVQSNSGGYTEEREPTSAERTAQMTVRGNVLSTEDSFEKGKDRGMRLKLATETGEVHVQLGPRWIKFRNDLQFTNGEPITIVGLKIQLEKSTAISAQEITRQGKTLNIRDVTRDKK